MAATPNVVIPYAPRTAFLPLHQRTERWAAIVAHRRAGKTVACVNDLIKRALENQRQYPPPRYGYLAPTYAQAKDVAWEYLKHYCEPIPGCTVREVDLQVVLPTGAIIRLYGADNYDRMRGLYFDGVVIDEPADIDPRAWPEVIRPALADQGGWAVFIGTPKGRNHFFSLVTDGEKDGSWQVLRLPASETGILPTAELLDARRTMSPEQYLQEFECSFDAAIVGAYYGKHMADAERDKRICGVAHDPIVKTWTAWDLGMRDSTAIWFAQQVGREIHLIDYYETSGMDLAHYVGEIDKRGYLYGGHIVPHDAQARELGTGRSRLEILESLGLHCTIAKSHRVEDGIEAVRSILPRCWFDATKCERGIDALKVYRAEYDDKLKALRPRPVHDWASHGADAFRYLAVSISDIGSTANFDRRIEYPKTTYA